MVEKNGKKYFNGKHKKGFTDDSSEEDDDQEWDGKGRGRRRRKGKCSDAYRSRKGKMAKDGKSETKSTVKMDKETMLNNLIQLCDRYNESKLSKKGQGKDLNDKEGSRIERRKKCKQKNQLDDEMDSQISSELKRRRKGIQDDDEVGEQGVKDSKKKEKMEAR